MFSRTLTAVHWNSTLVQANAVEEVRALKNGGDGTMEIGGANLAASVMPYGLIDEYQLFVSPPPPEADRDEEFRVRADAAVRHRLSGTATTPSRWTLFCAARSTAPTN